MSTATRAFLVGTAFLSLTAALPPSLIASPPARIQCCRTASGTAICQVKSPRACQNNGGINIGSGTCSPNPCAAPTTTSTSSTTTTTTTLPTGPCQCGTPDPTRLQFTTAVGSGNCGTLTTSTGVLLENLACRGLYVGGGVNSFPLPFFATPDMGTSVAKVASCAGTSLTLAAASSADTGSLRTCTKAGCLFGAPLPDPNSATTAISTCVINSLATDLTGTADCASGTAALNVQIKGEIFITGDLLTDAGHPGVQPCPLCEARVCHGGPNDGMACTPGDSAQSTAYPTSHDCPPPPDRDAMAMLSGPASLTTGTKTVTGENLAGPNSQCTGNMTPFVCCTGVGTGACTTQQRVFCGFCRDIDAAGTFCFEGDPNRPPTTSCPRNADCTGVGTPYLCCTGTGTGSCDQPSSRACTSSADCTDGNGTWPNCVQRNPGAFGAGTAKTITETGAPAGDLSDRAGHAATLASVFCIPPTFVVLQDNPLDLPGPGAVTYPGADITHPRSASATGPPPPRPATPRRWRGCGARRRSRG